MPLCHFERDTFVFFLGYTAVQGISAVRTYVNKLYWNRQVTPSRRYFLRLLHVFFHILFFNWGYLLLYSKV